MSDEKTESKSESKTEMGGKAFDLLKKAITVGVGAAFLTEESLRSLVSELKLPKELIHSLLQNANQTKNEFLQKLSSDVIDRIQSRVDISKLAQEFMEKNDIELKVRISVKPKGDASRP
jgi:predicted methyltransferase MtxX (methanogen marker protein 4)